MPSLLEVLALSAPPGLAASLGGFAVELQEGKGSRVLAYALHLAAGILLGVVAVEIMPRGLEAEQPWVIVLALVAGGCVAVWVDAAIDRWVGEGKEAAPWVIGFATMVDLFVDGLLIGTGSSIDLRLGLVLSVAQVPANMPEGFSTIGSARERGTSRRRRLLASVAFLLPPLLGGAVGYLLVRDRPELLKLLVLAFAGGILLTIGVEQMLVEAHRLVRHRPRHTLSLIGGFAGFALLSIYL